jgi:signal transduction histidine kinase
MRVPTRAVSTDAEAPLWLATAVLRTVTYLFAVGIVVVNFDDYARPWLAVGVLAVMGLWTPVTLAYCLRPALRHRWLVFGDVVVTCGLMLTSLAIQSTEQVTEGAPLITTVWASGPPVAAGVIGGWPAGAVAGLAVAAATAVSRHTVNIDVMRDAVLLIGAGFVVGMAASAARHSQAALARALRTEAATAERERLASNIHDSVLQVLARVRRRGAEVGGEAAELAALAGEQEIALRSLVASGPVEQNPSGEIDLRALLQPMATSRVQISVPGTAVLLDHDRAEDLAGVVREALLNAKQHAGADANAWVLLEDLPHKVVVSVRDDGVGMPDGRLATAASEGRLGVANSIYAKVRGLSGTVRLETAAGQGTEWEVSVPRPMPRQRIRRIRRKDRHE